MIKAESKIIKCQYDDALQSHRTHGHKVSPEKNASRTNVMNYVLCCSLHPK